MPDFYCIYERFNKKSKTVMDEDRNRIKYIYERKSTIVTITISQKSAITDINRLKKRRNND